MTHRTEQCCKECSGWEPALHECSCQCHYSPTDESVVSPTIPERVEEMQWSQELRQLIGEVAIKLGSEKGQQLADEIRKARTETDQQAREEERARVRERITDYVNKKFLEGVVVDPLELYEALTNKE